MTGKTIAVSAQWALHGKKSDDGGYRVLACSTGELSMGNFADALSRFQLGALTTLPQVSVSYAKLGTAPGVSYLALAIHWFAADGQRYADGVQQFDNHGRDTAFTSYFCLPYQKLAEQRISYLSMYEALSAVMLPVVNAPPREVAIAVVTPQVPVVDDDLALRVAPLLLTGKPVCVLGAEGTSMTERLRFIDAAMTLLPYGFRTRMTAATWTRATNREHRFKLFFTSAPRAEQDDHVVAWGDPDMVRIPSGPASDYYDWLTDKIIPLSRLPRLRTELALSPKAALQALELVEGVQLRQQPGLDAAYPAVQSDPAGPAVTVDQIDVGEETLQECAQYAGKPNLLRLRSSVKRLKKYAETGEIDESRRARYQELIASYQLLRHNPAIERYEGRLYEALLDLAFGSPLSYEGYCQVEQCLGITPGEAPHPELLAAIDRAGMSDPRAQAIVYWHLHTGNEKILTDWLRSGEISVGQMIDLVARDWGSTPHARIVCDVTLAYLTEAPDLCEPKLLRQALHHNGFLASSLSRRYAGNDQYQVHALFKFLRAAHPAGISRGAIIAILARTRTPPTPALLAAVLLLCKPSDVRLAHDAYSEGSVSCLNVDEKTLDKLKRLTPDTDPAGMKAIGPPPNAGRT